MNPRIRDALLRDMGAATERLIHLREKKRELEQEIARLESARSRLYGGLLLLGMLEEEKERTTGDEGETTEE